MCADNDECYDDDSSDDDESIFWKINHAVNRVSKAYLDLYFGGKGVQKVIEEHLEDE